jgi:hypothetical protein
MQIRTANPACSNFDQDLPWSWIRRRPLDQLQGLADSCEDHRFHALTRIRPRPFSLAVFQRNMKWTARNIKSQIGARASLLSHISFERATLPSPEL